ncbi:MAG: dephospho-CoA kinase [Gammaproteobacteria bacterium]
MFTIGLTGGIASGKSTAARHFADLGACVIDTDELAREVLAPGSDGLRDVVRAFGKSLLAADGTLNRRALRQRIFDDAAARRRLEALTHPRIEALLRKRLTAAETPYAVVEVPLLVESGWARTLDRVLVIDCNEDTQIRRLMQRDGETQSSARAALAAQSSRAARLALADDVILNEESSAELEAAVEQLHDSYLQLAQDEQRR